MISYATKIHMIGFQQHKDLEINLSPGVNIVVGPTGCGKSTIIRAFSWVVLGIPKGNDIRGEGCKLTSVAITWNTGHITKRIKSSTVNAYEITDPAGEVTRMDAVGANVPIQITELLGIQPFKCDKFDVILNISKQLGMPFLLDLSATDRMKIFNQLTGNDLLDKVLVSFNKDALNASKQAKFNEEQAQLRKTEIDTVTNKLMPLKSKLEGCLKIYNNLIEKQKTLEVYLKLNNKYSELCETEADISFQLSEIPDLSLVDISKLRNKITQFNKLQQLTIKLQNHQLNLYKYLQQIVDVPTIDCNKIRSKIVTWNKLLEARVVLNRSKELLDNKLKDIIDLDSVTKNVSNLRQKYARLQLLQMAQFQLQQAMGSAIQLNLRMVENDKVLQDLDKKYVDMLKLMKVCPTCKRSTEDCQDVK